MDNIIHNANSYDILEGISDIKKKLMTIDNALHGLIVNTAMEIEEIRGELGEINKKMGVKNERI